MKLDVTFHDFLATLPKKHLTTRPPIVAPSWAANALQTYGGAGLSDGKGKYSYDRTNERFRISTCARQTLFHSAGDEMCTDQLTKNVSQGPLAYNSNQTVGKGDAAVCKAFPSPYYDPFGWLAVAHFAGTSVVGFETCDLWAFATTYSGMNLSFSACIGSDGVPRQFNQSNGMAYKAASFQGLTLWNVTVGPLRDEEFAPSEVCAETFPMPPCPHTATKSFSVYRVHSDREPESLENRDTGDALGDMAFFCSLASLDETQLVTKWAVQANSSWGQYAYCLYQGGKNMCYGSTGKHVGRESALGLEGAAQGQCSANSVVGSWFAFPSEGHCPEGVPIGAGGCTWTATVARTVSARCIVRDRGLADSCARERGHAPMVKSAEIFRAALETSDPRLGGCPDAGSAAAPESQMLVV